MSNFKNWYSHYKFKNIVENQYKLQFSFLKICLQTNLIKKQLTNEICANNNIIISIIDYYIISRHQVTLNPIKFKFVNTSYFISKIFIFFYFYDSILFYCNNISIFFRRIFIVFNIILFDYSIVKICFIILNCFNFCVNNCSIEIKKQN